jgi:hypothetical protein
MHGSEQDSLEPPLTAGGLVPLEASRAGACASGPRPLAGFVTQLLACRDGAPAYRARRRAEPGIAVTRYGERGTEPPSGRFECFL